MIDDLFQPSLLSRDRKLFLELTPEEIDVWVTRVFDHIRPYMSGILPLILDEEDLDSPLNLELVLTIANRRVREVAVEMANSLFTPDRQQQVFPRLNAYCDELLAQGRTLDATFIQQGLIGILQGQVPGQNTLLVEVCMRAIMHQVSLINAGPHVSFQSQ